MLIGITYIRVFCEIFLKMSETINKQTTGTQIVFEDEVDEIKAARVADLQGSTELMQARLKNPPNPLGKRMFQLYGFCVIGFLCATMNGYDGSLMGSLLVMEPFQKEFGSQVDGVEAAYINSLFQIGNVCAIPFIAEAMDRFGRRFGIFIGCFIVVTGTIIQGTAHLNHSLSQFLAGRFFLGFGVSLAASSAPTYIVEIVHPAYRGVMAGAYAGNYDVGSVLSAAITRATNDITSNNCWLIPIWLQMVFSAIVCLFIWFIPESPRWLFTHGKQKQAIDFITKFHGDDDVNNAFVQLQICEFEEKLEEDGSDKRWLDYLSLFKTRSNRYRLFCSVILAVWAQISSGSIGSYFGAFLESAGITNSNTILDINLGQRVVSLVCSYIGASLCGIFGRRRLYLTAMSGIVCSWIGMTVGTAMYTKNKSVASARTGIAFYYIFNIIFSVGVTPLQGVYVVEVLSYEMRAKATALTAFLTSAAGLINQFATPIAMARIGWKTYIVYTCWNFFELSVSYLTMVETRGYTLEELNIVFEARSPRRFSTKHEKIAIGAQSQTVFTVEND